jgi:hypothetical protein
MLIADTNIPLNNRVSRPIKAQRCHESFVHSIVDIDTQLEKPVDVADIIYQDMLLPFADLICLFVNDLGGLAKVAKRIAVWLRAEQPSKTPPWLVLVVEGIEPQSCLEELEYLKSTNRVQGLHIHQTYTTNRRTKSNLQSIKSNKLELELRALCKQTQTAKIKKGLLFSARHLAGFFHYTGKHPAFIEKRPLNFIQISRFDHPVTNDLKFHLHNFLKNFKSANLLMKFAIPTIASSFILDQYPPGMHCKL